MMNILKKLAVVVAALVVLFVLAAAIIPMVVDMDQYRPQIVQVVNNRINGKFELGHLHLSLWGHIQVNVAGLKLTGADGTQIVAVKDAAFYLPFGSLLSGSPLITLKMNHPVLNIISDRSGKLNVMKLVKEQPEPGAPAQPQAPAAPSAGGGGGPVAVPGIVARARAGIDLEDATVNYRDLKSGLSNHLEHLNFLAKNLSLTHKMEIALWGEVNTTLGKTMRVSGPVRIDINALPKLEAGKVRGATGDMKADFDKLEIDMPGLLHKAKGQAANFEGAIDATDEAMKIQKMVARFFNAEINVAGEVTNKTSPVADLKIDSNSIDLKPWAELVPMAKEYALTGHAQFEAKVTGPVDKVHYTAKLEASDVTIRNPYLRVAPHINATIHVVTDAIDQFLVTMKAPENDLKLTGKLVSFTKPQLQAEITSSGLNLDKLIVLPETPAAARTAAPAAAHGRATKGASSVRSSQVAAESYDQMLDPLRKMPIARKTVGVVNAKLDSIQYYNAKMTDVTAHLTLRDLAASIAPLSLKVFGGTVHLTGATDLKPAHPTYRFTADAKNVKLGQAVQSQMSLLKNTVVGTAFLKAAGDGSSFDPQAAKTNLRLKGNFRVDDAAFTTIDVVKMAQNAAGKALDVVASKVPALRGHKLEAAAQKESRYDTVSSDFNTAGGKFNAPNFVAKAKPKQGIDLKGSTTVGMVDYSLNAHWEVIDTYDLLHLKEISAPVAGQQIPHILAEGNGPVKFPVSVGCTIFQPCYSYTEVPAYLTQVVLKNLAGGAKQKAESEVRKKLEQKAPPQLRKGLEGLGKKLFHR